MVLILENAALENDGPNTSLENTALHFPAAMSGLSFLSPAFSIASPTH